MSDELERNNFADIHWKFGGGVKPVLGHKVAEELLQINIDFNDPDFFAEKIRVRGRGTYNKGECLDALLDYYSILEIALKVDFIEDLDSPQWNEIIHFLQEGNVKNYCFLIYKSLLPIQLLERLQYGSREQDTNYDPTITSLLFQFFDLYEYVLQSNLIIQFLKASQLQKEQLFKSLSGAEALPKQKNSNQPNDLTSGYFRYMEFLQMFGDYLEATHFQPDLQNAVANFFIRIIDRDDERVNYVLEQTQALYNLYVGNEHPLVDDRSRYDYEDAFESFQKTLNNIQSAVTALKSDVPA